MKIPAAILFSSTILLCAPAWAGGGHVHGDVHTSRHGGVVVELGEMQYELTAATDRIIIYVEDHGRKIDTRGASGKLTLLNGSDKTQAQLIPSGENRLEAAGSFRFVSGSKAVAVIALPGKPPKSVRFAK